MALGTTNISVDLIKQTIGESSNDVGTLCKSANINKWSKYKPFISAALFHAAKSDLLADLVTKHYGLSIPSAAHDWATVIDANSYVYTKPSGGAASPYRLGDFRCYNHAAAAPVRNLSSMDARIPFDEHYVTLLLAISGSDLGIGLSELFSNAELSSMYLGMLFSKDNYTTTYLATSQATLATGISQVAIEQKSPFVSDYSATWKVRAVAVNVRVESGRAIPTTDNTLANAQYRQLPFGTNALNLAEFTIWPPLKIRVSPMLVTYTSSSWTITDWRVVLLNGTSGSNIRVAVNGISLRKSGESTWTNYGLASSRNIIIEAGSSAPSLTPGAITIDDMASPKPIFETGDTIKFYGTNTASLEMIWQELTIGGLE